MNILKLSWKNMVSRPLQSGLSVLLLTLGVGLTLLLLQTEKQLDDQMRKNIAGIDMVVGAKGSPLQLVLSALYQMDAPTGNISLKAAKNLGRNPLVEAQIPLSYGDGFQGARIIGTTPAYLDHYSITLQSGRIWEDHLEVVLGAQVANRFSLKIGDTFASTHGLAKEGQSHDDHKFEVVGIAESNGTVVDQLILTSLESVWHVHDGHDEKAAADRKITAMLFTFKSPMGMMTIPRMVNEKTNMQAALPSYEINRLFDLLGVGFESLRILALLIMIVSGISVFISLFQSLQDRMPELGLMRTFGASRTQLFGHLILEGLFLGFVGFIFGFIFSRVALWLLSQMTEGVYSFDLSAAPLSSEVWIFLATILVAVIAAFIPALKATKVEISKVL